MSKHNINVHWLSHHFGFRSKPCLMLGYSLSQQPNTEHLSILRRQRHGPDVAHSLLDGTWLRSASHKRQWCASCASLRALTAHSKQSEETLWHSLDVRQGLTEPLCHAATYPEHEVVLDFRLHRGVVHMERRQRL